MVLHKKNGKIFWKVTRREDIFRTAFLNWETNDCLTIVMTTIIIASYYD